MQKSFVWPFAYAHSLVDSDNPNLFFSTPEHINRIHFNVVLSTVMILGDAIRLFFCWDDSTLKPDTNDDHYCLCLFLFWIIFLDFFSSYTESPQKFQKWYTSFLRYPFALSNSGKHCFKYHLYLMLHFFLFCNRVSSSPPAIIFKWHMKNAPSPHRKFCNILCIRKIK